MTNKKYQIRFEKYTNLTGEVKKSPDSIKIYVGKKQVVDVPMPFHSIFHYEYNFDMYTSLPWEGRGMGNDFSDIPSHPVYSATGWHDLNLNSICRYAARELARLFNIYSPEHIIIVNGIKYNWDTGKLLSVGEIPEEGVKIFTRTLEEKLNLVK